MLQQNWLDDPSDYPLQYAFSYSLRSKLDQGQGSSQSQGDQASFYSLAAVSERSYTSSPLPAGLQTMNRIVACQCVVRDSWGCAAAVSQRVSVVPQSGAGVSVNDLSAVLSTQLSAALSSSDANRAVNVTFR